MQIKTAVLFNAKTVENRIIHIKTTRKVSIYAAFSLSALQLVAQQNETFYLFTNPGGNDILPGAKVP